MTIKTYNYEEILEDKKKFDEVFKYLREFGDNTLSYSILQTGMNYFILANKGIIAYAKPSKKSKARYVLGNPLADKNDLKALIKEFLNESPKSYFVQVSKNIAHILHKSFRLYATPMGIETTIDLHKFNLNGHEKRSIRNKINKCEKEKIEVNEVTDFEKFEDEIKGISSEWLDKRKKGKEEIRFLVRPLMIKSKESRIFSASKHKKMQGFIIFTPVYKSGKIIGYTADTKRSLSSSTNGTTNFILYKIIEEFKKEELSYLYLGLSPLHQLRENDNKESAAYPIPAASDMEFASRKINFLSKLLIIILEMVFKNANFIYNFRGQAIHKKKFEGKEEKVYFVHKEVLPVVGICQLFRVLNVI